MDVKTDERLLKNIEGYLIELVCNVKSIDELNLVAAALVSVQDALRGLPKSQFAAESNRETLVSAKLADSIMN